MMARLLGPLLAIPWRRGIHKGIPRITQRCEPAISKTGESVHVIKDREPRMEMQMWPL